MFVTNNERIGSAYVEFQFCKKKKPYFCGKLVGYKFWLEDSIFLHVDNFDIDNSKNIYPLLKQVNSKLNMYGPNYFDKEMTSILLHLIDNLDDNDFEVLKEFLKKAIEKYNGIYILGV